MVCSSHCYALLESQLQSSCCVTCQFSSDTLMTELCCFQTTVCWRSQTCRPFCRRDTRLTNMTSREDTRPGETFWGTSQDTWDSESTVMDSHLHFDCSTCVKWFFLLLISWYWSFFVRLADDVKWVNFTTVCESSLWLVCPVGMLLGNTTPHLSLSYVSVRAPTRIAVTLCSRKWLRWELNTRRSWRSSTRREERSVSFSPHMETRHEQLSCWNTVRSPSTQTQSILPNNTNHCIVFVHIENIISKS